MLCSHTVARGGGGEGARGRLPQIFFDKNGVIWCNLGRPKVCKYQPKNQQLNCHISLSDQYILCTINLAIVFYG